MHKCYIHTAIAIRFENEINILNYFMIKSLNQWNITFQCQNVNYKSIQPVSPCYYFSFAYFNFSSQIFVSIGMVWVLV